MKPTQPRIKPRSLDCRLSINNYVIRTLRHSLVNLMITTLWQLKSAERKWKHVATFSDLIISIFNAKTKYTNKCVCEAGCLSFCCVIWSYETGISHLFSENIVKHIERLDSNQRYVNWLYRKIIKVMQYDLQ